MMNIHAAAFDDIPSIMELERGCATAAHWAEEQYRRAIGQVEGAPERVVLAAKGESAHDHEIRVRIPAQTGGCSGFAGFLVARHVASEWELENIVVVPEFRGRGVGKHLLDALIAYARATNSRSISLEVRESNTAARGLYVRTGFRETGRRTGYYSHPPEDAILYSHDVPS